MERGAWWAAVHGGYKESDTTERLSTGLRYGDLFILMNIFQEFSWLVKKKKSTGLLSISTLRLLGEKNEGEGEENICFKGF